MKCICEWQKNNDEPNVIDADCPVHGIPADRPKVISHINWFSVVKLAESFMADVDDVCYNDDTKHYIFEAVIMAVYGESVWEYINKKLR